MRLIEESRTNVLLPVFLMGLFTGGMVKMLVYRAAKEGSLWNNLFTCPECGKTLFRSDRIPIIPSLIRRGIRKACGHRMRFRDPVIEITVAVAWVSATARLGLTPVLPAFLAFFTTLVLLSAVDLEHRRILNRVLAPMTVAALLLLTVVALLEARLAGLGRAALGALLYLIPMLALGLLIPESMGMGDIKLAGYLGLHLGWFSLAHVLLGAFLGFLVGAVIGLALIIAGKKGRKESIPFGPSMAAGAAIVVLLGVP